jgi:hypothetical protein
MPATPDVVNDALTKVKPALNEAGKQGRGEVQSDLHFLISAVPG